MLKRFSECRLCVSREPWFADRHWRSARGLGRNGRSEIRARSVRHRDHGEARSTRRMPERRLAGLRDPLARGVREMRRQPQRGVAQREVLGMVVGHDQHVGAARAAAPAPARRARRGAR